MRQTTQDFASDIRVMKSPGLAQAEGSRWSVVDVDQQVTGALPGDSARIDQLSSAKLFDILCMSQAREAAFDEEFIREIECELHGRSFFLESDLMEVTGL